nr:glycosyltransferase family 4 protein [Cohnella sp. REN36]
MPHRWPEARASLRKSLGWGDHHLVAGYIAATIYPNKGLREFIQAMLPIAVQNPRARLLIVGMPVDEEYVQQCRELLRAAGLADRAAWLGFEERIDAVYPAMDVLAVPSLVAEGFGMTALEGMAFGKPVVSFASGGLQEILEMTGNEAYLVTPGNVSGLTFRISTLLDNEQLRAAVGRRNAEEAQRLFGIEAFRASLDGLLRSLPPPGSFSPAPPAPSGAALPAAGLVRGSGPTVYWLKGGRRRPFPSARALLRNGFRFADVREVSDLALEDVPLGKPMPERPIRGRKSAGRRRRGVGRRRRGRAGRQVRTILSYRRRRSRRRLAPRRKLKIRVRRR